MGFGRQRSDPGGGTTDGRPSPYLADIWSRWFSGLTTLGPRWTMEAAHTTPASTAPSLARAVREGELHLCYQPKLHLRQRQITSVEALVRWNHPKRGLILPGDFIPLAEQTGEVRVLTEWVLSEAITHQRLLRDAGHDLPIFVNIAAVLLADVDFIAGCCATISESGAKIAFEITETSVIRNPEVAIANLKKAAGLGIPIAIDDYGAGLSSLAYLKQLPASELKIDKLFITQLTSSQRDPLIVRSTIDLAHALEMEIVAEGIENETALALLTVMGCDLAQGYHISRPIPFQELLTFIEQHENGWNGANQPVDLVKTLLARK